MPSEKLFIRDPREVPFLHGQVEILLILAENSSKGISVQEEDDFGFMIIQFLYKQLQHAESILILVPRRDAGLVARTMIEGLYQLLWAFHAPGERAKRWRSFSIIHDWRLIQERLAIGIPVEEAEIIRNEIGLKEFGEQHKVKRPKPPDPYHDRWRGGVSLSNMASVVGRELYEGPYAELSDWEHWGVAGIGDAIERKDDSIIVNTNSDRIAGLSLLAAFQCLFQTLELADNHFSLKITETLSVLVKNFKETLDSFYQK